METVSLDTQELPFLHAEDITSLIFDPDSGIARYRMTAKVLDVFYDDPEDPYWYFPKGVLFVQFDSILQIEGSIKADTAYYYEKREFWHLIGNVDVKTLKGEWVQTPEMYWNQRRDSIYSSKPVRLEQEADGRIFWGSGFRTTSDLKKNVTLFQTGGELPFEESQQDSIQ